MTQGYSKCNRCETFFSTGDNEAVHISFETYQADLPGGDKCDLCPQCKREFKVFMQRGFATEAKTMKEKTKL